MANQEKYTILYGRLSQEDDLKGDSNSIQNQRLLLEKYAKENGFTNVKFLYDDGYSGTNFNRPSWNELLGLIEQDQVETLIVKDYCGIMGLNQKDLENKAFWLSPFFF